jgi:hypothetical protein
MRLIDADALLAKKQPLGNSNVFYVTVADIEAAPVVSCDTCHFVCGDRDAGEDFGCSDWEPQP